MAPGVKDVSVDDFAELVGVSSQRIYQLIQTGLPHRKRASSTRIVPKDAIKWLRERDKAEALAVNALDEARERARKTRAEADIKELQLAELRRSLLPASDVSEFLEAFTGGFSSVAAGQLGRFERDIIKASTPAEARTLRNKIHRALMEGAQQFADKLDQMATSFESPGVAGDGTDETNDVADDTTTESASEEPAPA